MTHGRAERLWRCGDCDYVPNQTLIADKARGPGQSMQSCPRCRGDHTWTYDPPTDVAS